MRFNLASTSYSLFAGLLVLVATRCAAQTLQDTVIVNSKPWLSLPATPTLPQPSTGQYAPINGIQIWYNSYGAAKPGDAPVVLIHGGMGNANYFGDLISKLKTHHRVIAVDSRGHGRSFWGNVTMSYDLMSSDYVALLDYLKIDKAAFVGWSDGGIIALNIASTNPERVDRAFAFAANYHFSLIFDVTQSTTFMTYLNRTALEYPLLSPHPGLYDAFLTAMLNLWGTEPTWDASHFSTVRGRSTWFVGSDHDEAVMRQNQDTMFSWTPDSGLLIMPQVSHFAFIQNPGLFSSLVEELLHANLSS